MRAQYGEWINLKAAQKILHFSSTDAVLIAVQKGALPLPIRPMGSISTDLLAKYIANQYVIAGSTKRHFLKKENCENERDDSE